MDLGNGASLNHDIVAQLLLSRGVAPDDLDRHRNPSLRAFLPPQIPDTFADLKLPLTVIATDYYGQCELMRSEGDLYCRVVVETPVNLTPDQRKLMEQFEATFVGEDARKHSPKSATFIDGVKGFWDRMTS